MHPDVPSPRSRRLFSTDAAIAFALALIAFITRALFIYRDAMPDPDALLMAAGMAIDMSGDLPHGDALLYGRHVSPGAAFVVRAVYPLFFHDPRALVACLNWSSALLSALTASTMFLLARRYIARAAAAGAAAIWIGNPVAWESGTYFHTVVPSTLLLLVAMMLALHIERSRRGAAYFAVTVACAVAAFLTRTEVVFAAPALLVWTLTSQRARRDTLLLVSITAAVLSAYACVLVAIAGESTVPSGGFRAYTSWYAASFSPRGVDRTTVWTVFSLGIASVAAVLFVLARRPRALREHARLILFASAWVLPSALFWMLTPVPILRHFYVATVGVAWLVGVVVLQDARRAMATVAAIVALNLALPEAAYAAYRARTGTRKTPHGTFFSAHAYWSGRVTTFVALRERAEECMEASSSQSALAVTTWEASAHLIYQLGISGRRVHRITKDTMAPGIDLVRFDFDGGHLQIVQYLYFEGSEVQAPLRTMIEDARRDGACILVPERFRAVLGVSGASDPGVIVY
jgi:hypothetical protein